MGCKTIYALLFFFGLSTAHDCEGVKSCLQDNCVKPILTDQRTCCNWKAVLSNCAQDFIDVNRTVFTSVDTLKIFTGVLPVFLVARYADDDLHSAFYNMGTHKNKAQLPNWVHTFASKSVTAITATFAFLPFFNGVSEDVRHTCSVMTMGAISLSALRNFIKYSFKSRTAFRPWHESYSSTCRTLGGFPSGHMAMATYLASLYGLRHGAKWGVPLSAFAIFIGATSLNGNRHYASQLVGGFGLGFIYGFASYKLLNSRFGENLTMSLDFDAKNQANFKISYEF